MFRSSLLLALSLSLSLSALPQDNASVRIENNESRVRQIFDEALVNGQCYDYLRVLCKDIGGRLTASAQCYQAQEFVYSLLDSLGFDTVFKQDFLAPHWERGEKEYGAIVIDGQETEVPMCALGGSIGTSPDGLQAEVIEVLGIEDLERMGRKELEGKIVFFNRPMDPRHINTFRAYGGCVDQRYAGAMEAGKYGAKAVIVRSMSHAQDDHPHTGSMAYDKDVEKIPSMAIATNASNQISEAIAAGKKVEFKMIASCKTYGDTLVSNVVGEIRGTENPNEIILVGGHLDSWDNGEGAHDDGAGCVHAIEAIRILKDIGYKPKRTLRVVLFMNEENGLRGGRKYGEEAKANGWNHIVAIESDRGGFTPRGFHMEASDEQVAKVQSWRKVLEPYGLYDFQKGGSGADIRPLQGNNTILVGFVPDSQRYFDFHHAPSDILENVNKRELEMGAASMAALVYFFDQYGN
jgi:hypothetical protein